MFQRIITRAQQQLRWASWVTVATIDRGRKDGGLCARFAQSWDPV